MKTAAKIHHQKQQNDSYRQALQQWFTERRWASVYPILTNSDVDSISLRVLECLTEPAFVDECSRAGVPLSYYVESRDGSQRRLFNLPAELHAYQTARRKKHMEPFVRQNRDLANGGRFEFGYDEKRVETNVAQLQFFRFLMENNVLDWYVSRPAARRIAHATKRVRRHRDDVFAAKSRCESRRRQSSSPPPQRRKRARIDSLDVKGQSLVA